MPRGGKGHIKPLLMTAGLLDTTIFTSRSIIPDLLQAVLTPRGFRASNRGYSRSYSMAQDK